MTKTLAKVMAVIMMLSVMSILIPISVFGAEAEDPYSGATTISLDSAQTVSFDQGDTVYYKFVPEKDGGYIIEASDPDQENRDTYVEIVTYDEESKTYTTIASDDDRGEGNMFRCAFDASANKEYYIKVSSYDSEGSCSVVITWNRVLSIAFEPKTPYVIQEGTHGEVEDDEFDDDNFFWYFIPGFSKDDKLTVTTEDGTDEYLYDSEKEVFVSGEKVITEDDILIRDPQSFTHPWTVGKDNYFEVEYFGKRAKVQVEIIAFYIESIEYIPAVEWTYVENDESHGSWKKDAEGNDYFYYDVFGPTNGDKFITTDNMGNKTVYIYDDSDNTFVTENSKYLEENAFTFTTDQDVNHWKVGSDNYIIVNGYDKEYKVPVTITGVETHHEVIRCSEGDSSEWYCRNCHVGLNDSNLTDDDVKLPCDITYSFKDGVLTFSGTGSMCDMNESGHTKSWHEYRQQTEKIVISEGITFINDFAFLSFENVTEVVIPDSVVGIGQDAFSNCKKLESVILPDNLVYYGSGMFSYCESLTSVHFGGDDYKHVIMNTGGNIFRGADKLESIVVPESNFTFLSIDGVLYQRVSDDGFIELEAYPAGKKDTSYKIPKAVIYLGAFSVYGNPYLEHVNIQEGVTSIGEYAFCDLENLQEIEIPETVTNGNHVVSLCPKVEKIVNKSAVKFTLTGGQVWKDGKQYAIRWIDEKTDLFVDHLETGTVKRRDIITASYVLNNNIVQDGVTYTLNQLYYDEESGNPLMSVMDADMLNKQLPVAQLVITDYDSGAELPDILYYDAFAFDVIKHRIDTHVDAAEASCEKDGNLEHWICRDCGKFFADEEGNKELDKSDVVIKAKGHQYETTSAIEPTCTESGRSEEIKCSVCNKVSSYGTIIPPLGHDYHIVEGSAVEPTCIEPGKEADYKCSRCDDIKVGQYIPEKGHTLVTIPAVEPTCTENGSLEGSKCDVCGEIIIIPQEIPARGHEFNEVSGTELNPTCTMPGKEADRVCGVCGYTETGAIIPAPGHIEETINEVPPTCTEAGLTEGTKCSVCGEILVAQEETPAPGHNLLEIPGTETAPTCTSSGKQSDQKCSRCGSVFTGEIIPAKGHTEETIHAVDPTCTKAGTTEGTKCSECGEILVAPEEVEALGHALVKTDATEPTEHEDGNTEYWTCSSCGHYFLDETAENEIEHDSWIIPSKAETERIAKEEAVSTANETLETVKSIDADIYTASSYSKVTEAAKALEQLLSNDSTTSMEINEAQTALANAVTSLKTKEQEVEDRALEVSAAEDAVNTVSTLEKSDYTEESYGKVEKALEILEQAIADESTDSDYIRECREALDEAISGLDPMQENTIKVTAKTQRIKYSKLKKKTQTITAKKAFTVKSPQGKVTYKVAKYDKKAKKKITVSKTGKLTVKKGLKKGTYKVQVNVTAAGNSNYLPKTVKTTLKVVVK